MKLFPVRALCLGLFVLFGSLAYAQNGKITGKVTDGQGGVLPGATVVSKNVDTGMGYTLATNATGTYVFPSLPPGEYKVAVSMSGFRAYELNGLRLRTGRSLTVDAALSLSGVEETLTVTAETPLIQTRESKVGGVVDDVQIENVPINTRDVQQLALLVPGARVANTFDPTRRRASPPSASAPTAPAVGSSIYSMVAITPMKLWVASCSRCRWTRSRSSRS